MKYKAEDVWLLLLRAKELLTPTHTRVEILSFLAPRHPNLWLSFTVSQKSETMSRLLKTIAFCTGPDLILGSINFPTHQQMQMVMFMAPSSAPYSSSSIAYSSLHLSKLLHRPTYLARGDLCVQWTAHSTTTQTKSRDIEIKRGRERERVRVGLAV